MKNKKITLRLFIFLLISISALSYLPSAQAQTEGCPSDMIHYWKLDETVGPSYADFYGGNPATCTTSCPTATMGIIDGAQQFTTSTQVNVAGDDTFNWSAIDSFSIEFWMKTDSASTCSGTQVIVGRDDSVTQLHWWVGCWDGGKAGFYLVDKNGNEAGLMGATDLTDGSWHHIVAIRDASVNEIRIYVDGVKEDSVSETYSNGFDSAAATLNIGWLNLSGGYHFQGTIDEVALYNRALLENEIKQHYYDGSVGLRLGYCADCTFPIKVMPLGDSITHGTYGEGETRSEEYITGYRQPLHLSLTNAGYYVDFIGSLQTGQLATPSFDFDHQGVVVEGGFTAQNMADNVYNFLFDNPADVILLHIGTNDTNNTTATDIENILNEIDQYEIDNNENITVILAKIINRKTYHPYTTTLNTNVQLMAESRIASGDKIIIVDQESALDYTNDMWDNLHPNDTGYGKMANAWFVELSSFLPICVESAPIITSTPITEAAMGQSYTYDVDATGNPSPTYSPITKPSDMNINSATGLIEWTPTSAGMFDVVVEATNSVGTDTQSFTIQVLTCPSDMTHYWKLDESSSPYIDFYGGNNATCTNCPIATTGIISGAQQFISTTQVNVADDNTFDWGMNDSFSIEFWMKTDSESTCSGGQVIVGRDDPSSANKLHWWVGCWDGGKAAFVLRDKNGNRSILNYDNPTAKDLTDGQWHHIVAVRDASSNQMFIYVDGVLEDIETTSFSTGFDSSASVNIGWIGNLSSEYHFIGLADEIAIYNKALSDSDVLQHYKDGVSGYGYCTMPTYTLTVSGSGSGSGTVTGSEINCTITNGVASGECTKTYDAGTSITLNANVSSGSTFSGWSGNCSGTGSCNLTMDSDKNVTAQFTLNSYTLTINGSGNGSGTVTGTGINCTITNSVATGDCSEDYYAGTLVTLNAEANTNSNFTGWSGGGCSGTGQCVITMSSDATVTAAFSLKTFSITASAPGGHGTISCTPSSVNYGGSSTCTITPDANYHLSALTDNGADVIGSVVNNQYTISNVTTNHTVTATFAINNYTVTPSIVGNGSINPPTPQTVSYGSTASFTVTPNTGYRTVSVTGCGGTWTGTNPYTTGSITDDCTVTATFAANTGNVNGDGNVDIVDALLIARYAAGLLVNNFIHEAADVNCDGIVNIVDALLIARKAAGLPVPNWCSN